MLVINNDQFDINDYDKHKLIKYSDFFNQYYELAEKDEPIIINSIYERYIIKNVLKIITNKNIIKLIPYIVQCNKLLHFFSCHQKIINNFKKYINEHLDKYKKLYPIELFRYDYKLVDQLELNDILTILQQDFLTMTKESYIHLLTTNHDVVKLDTFKLYLKCFYDHHNDYHLYDDVVCQEWKERLNQFIGDIKIPDYVAMLGGSLSIIINNHLNIKSSKNECKQHVFDIKSHSDIDLYVWGDTKEERVHKINQCIDDLSNQLNYFSVTHKLNVYCITIDGQRPIQIINSCMTSLEDIFASFDLSCSRLGYYQGQLIGSVSGIHSIVTRQITINNNIKNLKLYRLEKYKQRGFHFTKPNLICDNSHKKQIIYDTFTKVKEYNVPWFECYYDIKYDTKPSNMDRYILKNKACYFIKHGRYLTYTITNCLISQYKTKLTDDSIQFFNNKLQKINSFQFQDFNILIPQINKNSNPIYVGGYGLHIQHHDQKDSCLYQNYVANVTITPVICLEDCSVVRFKVLYVSIKKLIY